jgi:hypothetical protein
MADLPAVSHAKKPGSAIVSAGHLVGQFAKLSYDR